jgi:hypothetical protein
MAKPQRLSPPRVEADVRKKPRHATTMTRLSCGFNPFTKVLGAAVHHLNVCSWDQENAGPV